MYDYSFIKNLNTSLHSSFYEFVNAAKQNMFFSVYILSNTIFEKAIKLFLIKENKINEFFKDDPNLTQMCLSNRNKASKDFVRSNLEINYDVVVFCRDNANNKKHDIDDLQNGGFKKEDIAFELLFLLASLNNRYQNTKVQLPTKEEIFELVNLERDASLDLTDVNDLLKKCKIAIIESLGPDEYSGSIRNSHVTEIMNKLNEILPHGLKISINYKGQCKIESSDLQISAASCSGVKNNLSDAKRRFIRNVLSPTQRHTGEKFVY